MDIRDDALRGGIDDERRFAAHPGHGTSENVVSPRLSPLPGRRRAIR
jgi:hypothetical protein